MKPFFPFSVAALAVAWCAIPAVAQPMKRAYVPPKAEGGVVALMEDDPDPLIPLLTNAVGGEAGTATREDVDVYSGLHAMRVAGVQRYEPNLPGWAFKIVEKPTAADEFRYVRFAWKKVGGTGIMVQLNDNDTGWSLRYVSGQNTVSWESTAIDDAAPAEWTVVTRDVFKDFKARTITGIAFTAMDGSHGLFDHVYLGRSVEDLDAKSKLVLGREIPEGKLTDDEFKSHWADLTAAEFNKAAAAQRVLLQRAGQVGPFVRAAMKPQKVADADKVTKDVLRLIAELDDDKFEVREAASKQLLKIGDAAREQLHAAVKTNDSAEVVLRCEKILKRLGDDDPTMSKAALRSVRIIRVLERANTPDALALLKELSTVSPDATVKSAATDALRRVSPVRGRQVKPYRPCQKYRRRRPDVPDFAADRTHHFAALLYSDSSLSWPHSPVRLHGEAV